MLSFGNFKGIEGRSAVGTMIHFATEKQLAYWSKYIFFRKKYTDTHGRNRICHKFKDWTKFRSRLENLKYDNFKLDSLQRILWPPMHLSSQSSAP